MNSREYLQPSAPPPPYESVVNDNSQTYYSNPYSNQNHSKLNEEYMVKLNQFINRYESEFFFLKCHLFKI